MTQLFYCLSGHCNEPQLKICQNLLTKRTFIFYTKIEPRTHCVQHRDVPMYSYMFYVKKMFVYIKGTVDLFELVEYRVTARCACVNAEVQRKDFYLFMVFYAYNPRLKSFMNVLFAWNLSRYFLLLYIWVEVATKCYKNSYSVSHIKAGHLWLFLIILE